MYNHEEQYRCTIIRGKSLREMDNLLSAYTKVVDEICPCDFSEFEVKFNELFATYLPEEDRVKKTLNNHRTEIAGKLFGIYYISDDGFCYASERTKKFLNDEDQPAFFKDICAKLQFPNGMQKPATIIERKSRNINIRPNAFVLKTLLIAKNAGIILTKKDIGYYVLNALNVLQGQANPLEVIEQIQEDRKVGIDRVVSTPGKAFSYEMQHINEQINYLELANLVITSNIGEIKLNENEMNVINLLSGEWNIAPEFNIYDYDLSSVEERKKFQIDWDFYYSKISKLSDDFTTTSAALGIGIEESTKKQKSGINLIELGDEGEYYVLEFEKQRVKTFNNRLVGKVIHLGKTKGLGYDIQSVIAEPGDVSEFVKYIEVKSTKRVTAPDINDPMWIDTINITRNEWIAAQQHKDFYSIFRVYFVRGSVIIYIIKDLEKHEKEGRVKVIPTTYRVDFGNQVVNEVVTRVNS